MGKKEFLGAKNKLEYIEKRYWVTINGVCHFSGSFDSIKKLLSGDPYSTFVPAFCVLRPIKSNWLKFFFFFNSSETERSKIKRYIYR